MKRIYLILLAAVILLAGFIASSKLKVTENRVDSITPTIFSEGNDQTLVGGDRDEHGCIPSAGYTWCEAKGKCLRIWEEACIGPEVGEEEIDALRTSVKEAIVAKHGSTAENLDISVSEVMGDYAKGGASEAGMGGGMWFSAKVDNEWQLVWDGNGTISCADLENYPDFPKKMIPECYDSESGEMRVR